MVSSMRVVAVVTACLLVAVAAWPERSHARRAGVRFESARQQRPRIRRRHESSSRRPRVAKEAPAPPTVAELKLRARGGDFDAARELGLLGEHDDRAIEALIDLLPHNRYAWAFARSGGTYARRLLLDVSWLPSHRFGALRALARMSGDDACPELVDGLLHDEIANQAAFALLISNRESLTAYREQIIDALEEAIPASGVKFRMVSLIQRLGPDAFRLREVIRVRLEVPASRFNWRNCRRALDAIDGMPIFPR